VANLEPVNALAEASPGYVWRLQDDSGDATHIRVFDDELMIISLTLWTSVEALADFVFRTRHVELLWRRRQWFEGAVEPTTCLYWGPEGTVPDPVDAIARLEHLRTHGPTPTAFTFRHRFEPGREIGVPDAHRDICPGPLTEPCMAVTLESAGGPTRRSPPSTTRAPGPRWRTAPPGPGLRRPCARHSPRCRSRGRG